MTPGQGVKPQNKGADNKDAVRGGLEFDNSDDNEGDDTDIMVATVELEKLGGVIDAIKPNMDPSVLDVQDPRGRTANILAQKLSLHQDAGFAWLVDDNEAYKRRTG